MMGRSPYRTALDAELLRDLCLAHGVSGYEEPVQALVQDRLAPTAESSVDVLGNLIASIGPEAGPQVVIAAHCDQIGLVVASVDENGYVSIVGVGMVDAQLAEGRELVILSESGPVAAVGGKPPVHLLPQDAPGTVRDVRDQWLDIGARSRDEALERVAPGDPIVPKPSFVQLSPGIFAGQAMDDRSGVYAVIRAAEIYAVRPGNARLDVLSSICEETGKLGARGQAMALRPQCTIIVDVEHATDQPGVGAKKGRSICELGRGPVLARGSCSNKRLLALARDVAAEEGIAVQIVASPAPTYTDADELQGWPGAANLNLGIPLRYMHSPLEVCCGDDLEDTAHLLAALTRRIGEVYEPGYFVTLA